MLCVGSKQYKNQRKAKAFSFEFGFVLCEKYFLEKYFYEKLFFGCLLMREQVKRLNLTCVLTSKF